MLLGCSELVLATGNPHKVAELRRLLATLKIPLRSLAEFSQVEPVDETGSTNDDVLEMARAGGPEGVVVVADYQTAGRGRLDRSWQAPPGSSLLVSILVRPHLPPEDAHLVSTAVAVAAVEACDEVAGVAPVIKWPNDLLLRTDDGTVRGKVDHDEAGLGCGRAGRAVVAIGFVCSVGAGPVGAEDQHCRAGGCGNGDRPVDAADRSALAAALGSDDCHR